jgi:phosphatidylinositol alpha-1,6-mannosyltransferase
MKIAVLTDYFPPQKGGFSRYTNEIVRNWALHGVDVLVVATIRLQNHSIDTKDEFTIRYISKSRRQGYFFAFLVFIKFLVHIFKYKPDLIFFPVWDPYSIFMVIFKWLPFPNFRYVVGCHGADVLSLYANSSYPAKRVFKKLGVLALQKADLVFAISGFTADELQKLGIPDSRIKIFPNGVDHSKFYPMQVEMKSLLEKYGIPFGNYPILLTVAQLNKRKGLDTGIELVVKLREQIGKVIYIIVGSGSEEESLRKLIVKHDLKNSVFILTSIEDNELVKLYNLCDIFLLLSKQEGDLNVEGFGIVLLEANACGKPVIGGNSGGIPDAIEDGKTGFIVNPLDIDQIHDKVAFLLDNTEIRSMMGSAGRKRVIEVLNWGIICQNMLNTINESIFNET